MTQEEIEQAIRAMGVRTGSGTQTRASFRDGLRAQFVAGFPGEHGEPGGARGRGLLLRLGLGGALAAAAALLLILKLRPAPEPVWTLALLAGDGALVVDGRDVRVGETPSDETPSVSQREVLGGLFEETATVSTGTSLVELRRADGLVLQALPGTSFRAPPEETGEGRAEGLLLSLEKGELYLRTAPGYQGGPVRFETPDTVVRVTGTALGVLVFGMGTCVCVAEGSVAVDPLQGVPPCTVETRWTHKFLRDGSDMPMPFPEDGDADSAHAAHLDPLIAFARH